MQSKTKVRDLDFPPSATLKGPDSQTVSGSTDMEREGREREREREKNKGKFTGTHIVIGGFETDRCETVSGDEIIF